MGALALVVAGYAGYAGWPWASAALAGSAAGIWYFSRYLRAHRLYRVPSDELVYGLAAAFAIYGGLSSIAFYLIRWIGALIGCTLGS